MDLKYRSHLDLNIDPIFELIRAVRKRMIIKKVELKIIIPSKVIAKHPYILHGEPRGEVNSPINSQKTLIVNKKGFMTPQKWVLS